MEPGSCCTVGYAELAGDLGERASPVEGLHQDRAVRGRQLVEGASDELVVEDPVQPGIVAALLGGLGPYRDRPGPGRPVGVDEQVPGDPGQPRPDWEVPRSSAAVGAARPG